MVDVGTAMFVSAVIGSLAGSVSYLIKDIVQNKIATGYLEASDEVSLGDVIEVNGEKGKVAKVLICQTRSVPSAIRTT